VVDNRPQLISNMRRMIDRALIDTFSRAVLSGDSTEIAAYFRARDIQPPTFRWNPELGSLGEAQLEVLFRWWQAKRPAGGIPSIDMVDAIELKDALGYLMILDVLEDGWDYRYRLYGTEISRHAKHDYTGQKTSDLKVFSTIPNFYIACYRAVLERPEPLTTHNQPPIDVATSSWTRLVLPLAGPDGRIARFLVGNVPGSWRQPRDEPLST
jgi:hypothetical protein